MKLFFFVLIIFLASAFQLCGQADSPNPPAEGFDLAGSDAKAVELADKVMMAMGGRKNWDDTRFIQWNFFGSRRLLWDKHMGRVRIESLRDSMTYLVDLNRETGRILHKGVEMTHPDSLAKYAKRGKSIWINDSYWLVMPYKLKDSGVTLKYLDEGVTSAGGTANVIQMTFKNVGDTPQNKYLIYVDPVSNLIVQWDYFQNASDPKPRVSNPWADYRQYGNILLSGNRGRRDLTEIKVMDAVDDKLFTEF